MQTYLVDQNYHQTRLDRWLKMQLPDLPHSYIARALRNKDVLLNDARAEINTRLSEGDVVKIKPYLIKRGALPEEQNDGESEAVAPPSPHQLEQANKIIWQNVIYQDDRLLVINKPVGVAVQGGTNIKTSIDKLLNLENPEFRIVHRLDRETSGVLLIAKSLPIARQIAEAFRQTLIHKTYYALTELDNKLAKRGKINLKLERIATGDVVVNEWGKPTETEYQVLAYFKDQMLVKLHPKTGFTHQLRVHLKSLGAPIIGDKRYNENRKSRNFYLHAAKLELELNGASYSFAAPLPDAWPEEVRNHV